jgi:hypothetical protein
VIRINTKSGNTYKFDLDDSEQASNLIRLLEDKKFQNIITGVTLLHDYKRRYRCINDKCKRISKMICPKCGELDDGYFRYTSHCTLIRPHLDNVKFEVEKAHKIDDKEIVIGEKLLCKTGMINLSITQYKRQPASRIILASNETDI